MAPSKTTIIALLLLGIVSAALSAGCPSDEDVSPCLCEDDDFGETTLSCTEDDTNQNDIRRALQAFDKDTPLSVELDSLNLGYLSSTLFQGLNVKKVEIWHCELESLSDSDGNAFTGLEDTLEELTIASSFTEENPFIKLDIGHLRSLKELDISYNTIIELGNDWFKHGPSSLTKLMISNNGIEKLEDRAFEKLVNLKSLHLDGNRFGDIKRSMLPRPANRLDELELDNNAFTSLPEDIFSGMPSLKSVSLRTNGLRNIPKETFQSVWEQLELLDLRGNSIECDSQIDWLFQVRTLARVYGTCSSPPEKEGKDLGDLLSPRGQNKTVVFL